MPGILTEREVLVLRQAHKQVRDKRLADRIKAILMVHRGFTYPQIIAALLLDERPPSEDMLKVLKYRD